MRSFAAGVVQQESAGIALLGNAVSCVSISVAHSLLSGERSFAFDSVPVQMSAHGRHSTFQEPTLGSLNPCRLQTANFLHRISCRFCYIRLPQDRRACFSMAAI